MAETTALEIIKAYIQEAEEDPTRKNRLTMNRVNWREYLGDKDWSHLAEGQNAEHLPKLMLAAEMMSALVRKAMPARGDWFDVEFEGDKIPVIEPGHIKRIMDICLQSDTLNFEILMADAVKAAYIESSMSVKVHGVRVDKLAFRAVPELKMITDPSGRPVGMRQDMSLKRDPTSFWELKIDLIPYEDDLRDPSGRDLYRIHKVRRELWEVKEKARAGIYIPSVLTEILKGFEDSEKRIADEARGKQGAQPARSTRDIVLYEVWGRLVNADGDTITLQNGRPAENILAVVANRDKIIRGPVENPRWDGLLPIISAPLLRNPFALHHKAMADHIQALNDTIDKLFSLIEDEGFSSVWGIKEIQPDLMDDPSQAANGLPPGITLTRKLGAPTDAPIVKRTDIGQVSGNTIALLNILMREFDNAAMINRIGLGAFPERQVKATEIVAANQSMDVFLDGMVKNVDSFVSQVLESSFMLVMQHFDEIDPSLIIAAVGRDAAFSLLQMSPAQRFEIFGNRVRFRVGGLAATVARAREFQKIVTLLQLISKSPPLFAMYAQTYSLKKLFDRLLRTLDIDTSALGIEGKDAAAQARALMMFAQTQGAGGAPQNGPAPMALPSASNGTGLSTPPGIEGGGGENAFTGMSMNERSM